MNRWRLWVISIAAVIVSSVSFLAAWVLLTGDQPPPPQLRIWLSCHGPYADHTLMADEFSTVLSTHQAWLESGANPKDDRRANLCRAKFSEVRNMFYGTDLRGAIFMMANLQGASFSAANLQGADFGAANLQGADFSEADLQGADFGLANLTGVIYEPNPESLPLLWTLTSPDNHLDEMVFSYTPAALVALREAFKKAGMRSQERQLTYAIEHIPGGSRRGTPGGLLPVRRTRGRGWRSSGGSSRVGSNSWRSNSRAITACPMGAR